MVPSRLISIHGDTNCLGAGVFHALVHVGYLILTYLVHGLSQRKLGPFHVRLGSSTVCALALVAFDKYSKSMAHIACLIAGRES